MKIPKFNSDKEIAEFWDKNDAAEYMENGEICEIQWEKVED
ncbi:MAG: CopG family antitoxin [Methanosarcinales archaeon]